MKLAILRLLANSDQGRNTRTTVFPLNTGRWSFIVWWKTTNHFVRAVAQEYGVSHETIRCIMLHVQKQHRQQEG
jgi:hypothetical protein